MGLNLPIAQVRNSPGSQSSYNAAGRICFDFGRLIYCKDKNFDKLFITCEHGFPYAAIILMYFFAEDTIQFDPEFVKPYQTITINGIAYTKLSPTLYDQFIKYKFATLERNNIIGKDCRFMYIDFTDKSFKHIM